MRIDKHKAMEILGIAEATLSRRLKNEQFKRATGAAKTRGKTNPVWTFDDQKTRQHAARLNDVGDDAAPDHDGELSTAPDQGEFALERRSESRVSAGFSGNETALALGTSEAVAQIRSALLLPHERALTLKEAAKESGIPQAELKEAIRSGKLKARAREMKPRIFKGREITPVKYHISLISLKQFVYEYLNGD